MVLSPAMPTAPVAVIDALNSLLEAEQNSIFRFMEEGSPYLSRATVHLRQDVARMAAAHQRHAQELYELIDSLGGAPIPRGLAPEEQYLAYLSLKFLLPKLVEASALTIQRYDNALKAIRGIPNAPAQVTALLNRQQAEHRAQFETLRKADVSGS